MGFARKSSKLVLTSMVIAGMMMSSCGENGSSGSSGGIGHWLHKAWDWLIGKQPKWKREQAKKNAESVANWQQTLSKVNIKALPKELRQCFKVASALSGVPLPVMYAIGLNETNLDPRDNHVMANDGLEGRNWDCGIMQDNTLSTVCPLANRLAHNMHIFDYYGHRFGISHTQLLAEIKALGLKYVGGGDKSGWCNNLTHEEAVEYCRELNLNPEYINLTEKYGGGTVKSDLGAPLTSNPACLSVFMGAYELAYDMWHLKYDPTLHKNLIKKMIKDGAYEDALQNAGQSYLDWVLVAYMYNGVIGCSGLACYFDKFARHLHGILTGIINVTKKL
jgi:hypothetical protein